MPGLAPPPGLSPAPSAPLTLWLPPAAAPIWLAEGLLALGAAAQVVGYSLGRVGPLLWGAGLVLGAAWLDKDVTLAVGQLLVTALALPLTRERGRRRP